MDKKEFLLSKGSSLSEINTVVPKTAVDVFVYDTSKDSDGGAWRKRTQHTSWYNERLNTTTRGSRKEFPAVAVIVAEADKVTIYDGDDPSLPMWMVFNTASYKFIWKYTTSVTAINSRVCVGGGSNTGLHTIDFIEDSGYFYASSAEKYSKVRGSISDRSVSATGFDLLSTIGIVNSTINDIAMTVLPNAPIDPATQLPIPTIAVATNDGVSVIKDDGSVVDYTHTAGSYDVTSLVDFLDDNRIVYGWDFDSTPRRLYITPILDSDTATVDASSYPISTVGTVGFGADVDDTAVGNYHGNLIGEDQSVGVGMSGSQIAVGDGSSGLNLIDVQSAGDDTHNSLINYITSDYQTGWMHGNIKLATLSDTNAADVTGSNLITVDFTDTNIWTAAAPAYISSVTTNSFTATQGGTGYGATVFPDLNQTYVIDLYFTSTSAFQLRNTLGSGSGYLIGTPGTGTNAHVSYTFKPSEGDNNQFLYLRAGSGGTITIHSLDVRIAEEDRSVNGNGLQVFGTVTKTPVNSGNDLVAYSNFSTSNYLAAPASNITAPGTGDFSVMFWVKKNSNITCRTVGWAEGATTNRFDIYLTNTGGINMYPADGGNIRQITSTLETGVWKQVVGLREGDTFKLYIDGELKGTSTINVTFDYSTNERFYAGCMSFDGGATMENLPLDGSLALVRVSHTAPTAEQIKKIYEDEKVLFQEGAKSVLAGTSDAVTALAYDDDTELLHVGTSSGRSVFQGLRRVDNTTRAVDTAISAVDGFVVEE
jgi:hypothetical protein